MFGVGPVANEIESFCEEVNCVRIVLAGWIDYAIVEIAGISESPLEISKILEEEKDLEEEESSVH